MGGGASRPGSRERAKEEEGFQPSDHLAPDQHLVIEGLLWKLNAGADPKKSKDWELRKCWLTSCGGLFTYSHEHHAPVGRSVSGLLVRSGVLDKKDRFAFEVAAPDNVHNGAPTILAARKADERDRWVAKLQEAAAGDSNNVSPLGVFGGGGIQCQRRRMSRCSHLQERDALAPTCSPTYPSEDESALSKLSELSEFTSASSKHCLEASMKNSVPVALLDTTGRTDEGTEPDSPLMPRRPEARRDSQLNFTDRTSTTIVLDWDDTIFPTTWIREDLGLNWRKTLVEQAKPCTDRDKVEALLAKLSARVETFVRGAHGLARVVVVTLAQRPWVDISSRNFMPGLGSLLNELHIKVVYAREHITDAMQQEYDARDFRSGEEEANFWMRAKANAMVSELSSSYDAEGVSWKNLVSFGDSEAERVALITAADEYMPKDGDAHVISKGLTGELITKDGHRKRLRAKTIKMVDEPSCEELIAQIHLFASWLPYVVSRDSGLNVEIPDTDDDVCLRKVNEQVTGHCECPCWVDLADAEL